MINKVSICVPAWSYHGYGHVLIEDLLISLKKQTNQSYEVIISDQSQDDKIKKVCDQYSSDLDGMDIKHNFFDPSFSFVVNYMNAEKYATGDIIKPLYQADFISCDTLIDKVIKTHNENEMSWAAYRFNHCDWDKSSFFNEMIPRYNSNLVVGVNTIGSPSVCSYSAAIKERVDEKLQMMVDCDHYFRLHDSYGSPVIVDDECYITNRVSDKEAKNESTVKNNIPFDINHIINKHNLKNNDITNINASPFAMYIK